MSLWKYVWAWSLITKGLYHFDWNSNDSSWNTNNWSDTNINYVSDSKIWKLCASFNWTNSIINVADFDALSPS